MQGSDQVHLEQSNPNDVNKRRSRKDFLISGITGPEEERRE
jgi:hypothetical protein